MNFAEFYTATDHFALVPAILLMLFGCAILLFDKWLFPNPKHLVPLALTGLGFTGFSLWKQQAFLQASGGTPIEAFKGALLIDGFGLFFNWIFLAASAVIIVVSYKYLEIEGEHHGEYYGLILLAQSGMYFLATGTDLVTLFIGLELMALCFYIMVGFLRGERRSNEAALKYLILGAFSSGFLAYGFSLLYGMSGSTKLGDITRAMAARDPADPLSLLALATVSVGLLFKISAVPFHMWAPDAYEGAPTTVTAYLSVASKAASFAFLLRMFLGPLAGMRPTWEPLLAIVAVATMTVGNLAAITQSNVKRMLAYSSISHAGYMLLGLIAGSPTGLKGVAVYILMYTFMNLGAFLVLIAMRRRGIPGETVDDLNGLMRTNPGYAILMLIFLVSLAGIPPTSGFIAKYYIFLALIETGHYVLAIIGVLYVAVAVYYYFRLVRSMFLSDAAPQAEPLASTAGLRLALGVTVVATLGMGIFPERFLQLAQTSLLR